MIARFRAKTLAPRPRPPDFAQRTGEALLRKASLFYISPLEDSQNLTIFRVERKNKTQWKHTKSEKKDV